MISMIFKLSKRENWTPELIWVHRTRLLIGFCLGWLVSDKHIICRKANAHGTVGGWVPGHGGDVYWVKQGKDVACYGYKEIEFEDWLTWLSVNLIWTVWDIKNLPRRILNYNKQKPPMVGPGRVSINLNDYVYVKVTDAGKKMLPSWVHEKDGYTEMQIHEFCHVFGPHLANGFDHPFQSLNIEFNKGDLEEA
jgi:hypothetical protein